MLPVQMFAIAEIAEERQNRILARNIERYFMRSDNDPFRVPDNEFQNLYRLSKDMVNYLIVNLGPHMIHSLHGRAVEPKVRILTALFFYATGSYQRVVGQNYQLSMAQNTVCKYVHEVTNLIIEHLANNWIVFPQTDVEKTRIKYTFMERANFPGVIGAIDCTHVSILKPSVEEHNYLNRKGYHSKNVQIICDYNLRILNINSRYAGASHDSYIWRNSEIFRRMEQQYNEGDTASWLIGDSGYPQQPWLMTPVQNAPAGSAEERYNERHASARNCIERCNGVLKSRFRCISGERTLRYSPDKAGNIIIASAVLHNICVEGRLDVYNNVHLEDQPNIIEEQILPFNQGYERRRHLIHTYFN